MKTNSRDSAYTPFRAGEQGNEAQNTFQLVNFNCGEPGGKVPMSGENPANNLALSSRIRPTARRGRARYWNSRFLFPFHHPDRHAKYSQSHAKDFVSYATALAMMSKVQPRAGIHQPGGLAKSVFVHARIDLGEDASRLPAVQN